MASILLDDILRAPRGFEGRWVFRHQAEPLAQALARSPYPYPRHIVREAKQDLLTPLIRDPAAVFCARLERQTLQPDFAPVYEHQRRRGELARRKWAERAKLRREAAEARATADRNIAAEAVIAAASAPELVAAIALARESARGVQASSWALRSDSELLERVAVRRLVAKILEGDSP